MQHTHQKLEKRENVPLSKDLSSLNQTQGPHSLTAKHSYSTKNQCQFSFAADLGFVLPLLLSFQWLRSSSCCLLVEILCFSWSAQMTDLLRISFQLFYCSSIFLLAKIQENLWSMFFSRYFACSAVVSLLCFVIFFSPFFVGFSMCFVESLLVSLQLCCIETLATCSVLLHTVRSGA